VMFGLTIMTQIMILVSMVRVRKITKTMISSQMAIHICILIQSVALLIYYTYYDEHWLRSLFELLKILTFMMVGYFFSYSALRLRLLPSCIRPLVLNIGFTLFFCFVVTITVLMIYWGYDKTGIWYGCKNIARVILAGAQFFFCDVFWNSIFLNTTTHTKRSNSRNNYDVLLVYG